MREQSNPGGRPWMSIILCFCCPCAELAVIAENMPRPASARTTPARTMHTPIKTRGLKNADCEVGFFFIDGIWDEPPFLAETTKICQHYFWIFLRIFILPRSPGKERTF